MLPTEHCPCCYYRHTFAFANRINYALLSDAAGPFWLQANGQQIEQRQTAGEDKDGHKVKEMADRVGASESVSSIIASLGNRIEYRQFEQNSQRTAFYFINYQLVFENNYVGFIRRHGHWPTASNFEQVLTNFC